ncbi:MAG: hypothetical protein HYV07_08970 [Deltaproteobacteria bacterium]|nr:hypothetical protein [Deltaproteobacteria bacterium]
MILNALTRLGPRLVVAVALVSACEDRTPRPTRTVRADGSLAADGSIPLDGSSPDAAGGDASPNDSGSDDSGMMALLIPDPPTTSADEWPDTEPNDTPDHAVPVGVLNFAFWMGFGSEPNQIATDTDVDYYVFRTGADLAGFAPLQICASDQINLFDLALYEVQNRAQGALVREANSSAPSCETLMSSDEVPTLLHANSVYLLRVGAAPGLSLGGSTGMYSA